MLITTQRFLSPCGFHLVRCPNSLVSMLFSAAEISSGSDEVYASLEGLLCKELFPSLT